MKALNTDEKKNDSESFNLDLFKEPTQDKL